MNTTENRVRSIIKDNMALENSADQIGLDDDLIMVGLNSTSAVKLIVSIEKEFGFEFDDEDLKRETIQTINRIISYINKKCSD